MDDRLQARKPGFEVKKRFWKQALEDSPVLRAQAALEEVLLSGFPSTHMVAHSCP